MALEYFCPYYYVCMLEKPLPLEEPLTLISHILKTSTPGNGFTMH
jgi:hypothetical protein